MKIGNTEVFLDKSGRVAYGIDSDGRRVYPYVWCKPLQAWTNRAGWYKPNSLREALKAGRVVWF